MTKSEIIAKVKYSIDFLEDYLYKMDIGKEPYDKDVYKDYGGQLLAFMSILDMLESLEEVE